VGDLLEGMFTTSSLCLRSEGCYAQHAAGAVEVWGLLSRQEGYLLSYSRHFCLTTFASFNNGFVVCFYWCYKCFVLFGIASKEVDR